MRRGFSSSPSLSYAIILDKHIVILTVICSQQKRNHLVDLAERKTTTVAYALLFLMGFQFGFLARLTWWEYSWDIMEPVTYFVTYGTAVLAYAYYVVTRQVSISVHFVVLKG